MKNNIFKVSIHIKLIIGGKSQHLMFGLYDDLNIVTLDEEGATNENDGLYCRPDEEATDSIKIQNGKKIGSKCIEMYENPIIKTSPFCIEIRPSVNKGDAISILRNDEMTFKIPKQFTSIQNKCFDNVDLKNDIFELKNGGPDGVRDNLLNPF